MSSERPSALDEGTTLGNYLIVRPLGAGAMGTVYEALHQTLRKRVALKTLNANVVRNASQRERFLREGQAANRTRHPHVVDVTDIGQQGDTVYLVMEYLEGESLGSLLRRRGRLPVEEALSLLLPVLSGVMACHEAGVIHRDLKPENIFLERSPRGPLPKVLDFGIAKLQDQAITSANAILGTPRYMAPEHIMATRAVDRRSDVFSLGVILYQMLVGRHPWEFDNLVALLTAMQSTPPPAPRSARPELPPGLESAVLQAISAELSARTPSVGHLGAALLPYASERDQALWRDDFAPWHGSNPFEGTKTLADPGPSPSRPAPRLAPRNTGTLPIERAGAFAPVARRRPWRALGIAVGALLLLAAALVAATYQL